MNIGYNDIDKIAWSDELQTHGHFVQAIFKAWENADPGNRSALFSIMVFFIGKYHLEGILKE